MQQHIVAGSGRPPPSVQSVQGRCLTRADALGKGSAILPQRPRRLEHAKGSASGDWGLIVILILLGRRGGGAGAAGQAAVRRRAGLGARQLLRQLLKRGVALAGHGLPNPTTWTLNVSVCNAQSQGLNVRLSAQVAPWLAMGCLSPRRMYAEVRTHPRP